MSFPKLTGFVCGCTDFHGRLPSLEYSANENILKKAVNVEVTDDGG